MDRLEVADVGLPHLVRVQPRAETEGEVAGEAATADLRALVVGDLPQARDLVLGERHERPALLQLRRIRCPRRFRRDLAGEPPKVRATGCARRHGQVRRGDRDVALDRVGDEHSVSIHRVALAVCPDDELRDGPHRLDGLSLTPGVDKKDGLAGEVRDRRPLVVRDRVRHVPEDRSARLLVLGVAVDVLSSRRALWTC